MNLIEFDTRIENGRIEVPVEYQNKFNSDVKVIIYSKNINDKKTNSNEKIAYGFGMLAHRANTDLWKYEDSAWEKAMVDKYGNS